MHPAIKYIYSLGIIVSLCVPFIGYAEESDMDFLRRLDAGRQRAENVGGSISTDQSTNLNPDTESGCKGFVCCSGPDCDFDAFILNLNYIIKEILKYAFVFMALMFAYAGFKYMKSSGNPSAISEAHSMFKKAVIGTLIVLLSFLIVREITKLLKVDESFIKLE